MRKHRVAAMHEWTQRSEMWWWIPNEPVGLWKKLAWKKRLVNGLQNGRHYAERELPSTGEAVKSTGDR
jgi:hypothetical protein